jgi:hypothetical protein
LLSAAAESLDRSINRDRRSQRCASRAFSVARSRSRNRSIGWKIPFGGASGEALEAAVAVGRGTVERWQFPLEVSSFVVHSGARELDPVSTTTSQTWRRSVSEPTRRPWEFVVKLAAQGLHGRATLNYCQKILRLRKTVVVV